MTLIKINTSYYSGPEFGEGVYLPSGVRYINPDKIVEVCPNLDGTAWFIDIGKVDHFYTVTAAEWERIAPSLTDTHVPVALPDKVIASWNEFDKAGWSYMKEDSAVNGDRFELTRAMFLTHFGDWIKTDTTPAPTEAALPAWNEGVNTLAFSKLMDAWYEAKKIVSSFNGQEAYRLEAITAVKDAYYAVINYVNKAHPIIEETGHE